jgi:hypothetical protein
MDKEKRKSGETHGTFWDTIKHKFYKGIKEIKTGFKPRTFAKLKKEMYSEQADNVRKMGQVF